MHLWWGREGLGWQRHHYFRIAAPLRQQGEPPVRPAARSCYDPFGDFALEHQRQAGPDGRPDRRCQPADQKLGPDIVGQVRHDPDRRRQSREGIYGQRVARDDLQPAGIGGGDLGQGGQAARILLDGAHLARARGEQAAGQTAGAGTDLDHVRRGQVACGPCDARGQVEVEDEVLAKRLFRGQVMRGDDLAQGGQAVDGGHQPDRLPRGSHLGSKPQRGDQAGRVGDAAPCDVIGGAVIG